MKKLTDELRNLGATLTGFASFLILITLFYPTISTIFFKGELADGMLLYIQGSFIVIIFSLVVITWLHDG